MRGLIRAAAALVALGLLVVLARRLLSPRPPGDSVAAAGPAPAAVSAPGASPGPGEPTRQQLYEEAQRLEIKGRSKMTKAELMRAVTAAKKGDS